MTPGRHAVPVARDDTGDRGSVLIFVMVLIVLAGLIVVPVMQYTATVLRANRVVSDQAKQSEAVKGGLRVALSDPKRIFNDCDNSTTLASTTVNGYTVATTCTELEEVGPAVALGFEVPVGAVATQVGHEVPDSFSGGLRDSGPVPPYPATADWWAADVTTQPETGRIWMPHLPRWPSVVRSSTPLDMPAGFDCQVFLPGSYADRIDLTTGNFYFASGVYYFADTITVSGDARVVVGYGLADLGTDCADDLQVATNVIGNIGAGFGISGGGATWVLGEDARVVVDDTGGGAPSLVFNQRYDSIDRGGRINIMTVNGDERTGLAHDATDVNLIPRSLVQNDPDELVPPVPIAAGTYEPSAIELTDAARAPSAPGGLTVDPYSYDAGTRGLVVVSWGEVVGQATGGAVIDRYDVTITPGSPGVCDSADLTVTAGATAADPVTFTCVIADVGFGNRTVEVRSENAVDQSPAAIATVNVSATSPAAAVPDAPTAVSAADSTAAGVARVAWNPAVSTTPVTGYRVDAYEVAAVIPANAAPVTPLSAGTGVEVVHLQKPLPLAADNVVTAQLRAFDPNGDTLTLAIDDSPLPVGLTATADDTTDTVAVRATDDLLLLPGAYTIPYSVTDPAGVVTNGELRVNLLAVPPVPEAPVADVLTMLAGVGVPVTSRAPVSDIDGLPFAAVPIVVDTSALDPVLWTVVVNGLDVTVTTTAADGVYTIPYTVTGALGSTASSTIEVTVARSSSPVGSCAVTASPGVPLATTCEIPVPDIVPAPDPTFGLGYRFDVVATNDLGDSAAGSTAAPYPAAFGGTGSPIVAPLPLQRDVVPWVPDPVIEIVASDAGATVVTVPGYVSVPMGRIRIDNPDGDAVSLDGGVLSGTFDVVDGREVVGTADTVPIGFRNDIVLQRKVRIISTAGSSTSVAIVQVNEDGAAYAVNQWSIS